ncbi:hypothetical protein AB8B21_02995 [Tardiphaga sp. 866_E4_N2_1]|uniref:hypothetical protein n=1 Tax=unclassified Tardiphaga TaxID=2631404 RepID=UPI003F224DF9
MTDKNAVAEVRRQIDSGQLSGDRLNEARLWLGREAQRDAFKRKRKKYGVQLLALFVIVILALGAGSWVITTLTKTAGLTPP